MRKKLNIFLVIVIVSSSLLVAGFLTFYSKNKFEKDIQQEKSNVILDISQDYDYFNTLVNILIKNVENQFKNNLIAYAEQLNKGTDLAQINPIELLQKAKEIGVGHLYIINKDAVIINSSLEAEIGYDLHTEGKEFMKYFNNIFVSNEFVCQSIAHSSVDNSLMLYLYYSPLNSNFILEASVDLDNYLTQNYNRKLRDLIFWNSKHTAINNKLIDALDAFNLVEGERISLFNNYDSVPLKPDQLIELEQNLELSLKTDNGEEYFKVIKVKGADNFIPIQLLLYVKFNYSSYNKEYKRLLLINFMLFFLVLIVVSLISVIVFSQSFMQKIEIINFNLESIKLANYNQLREFSGNDELSDIATKLIDVKNNVMTREHQLFEAKLKAEESDRLKSAFLANMSHEIRTPLNAIVGFSNLLVDIYKDTQGASEFVMNISENSNRLLNIISDLIDISQIESNQLKLNYRYLKIIDSIDQLINFAKQRVEFYTKFYEREAIEVITNVDDYKEQDIEINTDPYRLNQILEQLLDNAAKFTTHGSVSLFLNMEKDKVIFTVKDTGIGIDLKNQTKIFDRFIQVEDHLTREYGGTGLGLAISRELALLLGGTITLESKLGEGSTFNFILPIKK